ncbi:acyl-CoA dehydrogenase family protein [Actinomycetospora termitidis]|uniref:Acyl-CoA dehydrogenase family protein n=1 Tax=Actinomycetospora termitidis TaxID=3053470 RepID=A0ABT7MEI5_9PSEU|nr:acyl-CoA dehydrogenase family protein [Actinomycetospora sp. Odt1-22]MDL5159075.1 acyl-CoA dehydrogenase family protein [Actinomycetospora sp. Odt1-22]
MIFSPTSLSAAEDALRHEVRAWLAKTLPTDFRPGLGLGGRHDPEFSRALAAQGWVGMSIPEEYGGAGATTVERFVVVEELLAAGAPITAHWIAERQTAPALLRFGTEEQRRWFLPRIAAGECFFSLGMSEPDAGSDLASVKTTAVREDDGWRVSGTKVWTTNAHLNHFFVVLCRTSTADDRHAGLSQLIVDLSSPGVSVSPIPLIDGELHVNEVVLDDVYVPDDRVLGDIGQGWTQVTAELAHERSGPDRYCSVIGLLHSYLAEIGVPDDRSAAAFGRIAARLWSIRQLSLAVARSLDEGEAPATEAALVKDVGTIFEQQTVETIREIAALEIDPEGSMLQQLLAECVMNAPSWTLRGGTTEILRGIAAKALTRGGAR